MLAKLTNALDFVTLCLQLYNIQHNNIIASYQCGCYISRGSLGVQFMLFAKGVGPYGPKKCVLDNACFAFLSLKAQVIINDYVHKVVVDDHRHVHVLLFSTI